jgi:D-arabinose 1-dehydrogenase-like Zn-dependent alcohol dehydrogenase
MKAAQIARPGGDFEIVDRESPKATAGHVRIKVQACGVCHSDMFTKEGLWPGIQYPRVPGHEVAGVIDELGDGVTGWADGQRVGVGWHGGHDGTCLPCRRGDFGNCRNLKVSGISYDGGYQQYMVAPVEALTAMPEGLDDVEAAPLLCAGITTYNALRHSGASRATSLRCWVSAVWATWEFNLRISSGTRSLRSGAGQRMPLLQQNSERTCTSITRRRIQQRHCKNWAVHKSSLATAPSSKAMTELFDGLGPNGRLVVVGASTDPIGVTPVQLIMGSRAIQGWSSGTPADAEDTLQFAKLTGVRPMIETYPLEKAAEAYARMMSGHAQFRVVLTM